MSKDKLTDYSATAASNTDIGGINIDEGMLPSGVNNALREQMSHLADFAAGTTGIDVLNLQDDDASHSIKIQAPASVTATTTFTLPDGDGSANQSLVTNGSGTLSFSTRLANVVEDTTPQLGGDLDTNGNRIKFGDSNSSTDDRLTFGDSIDMQLYHDGTDSYVRDTGTGDLKLVTAGTAVRIATDGDENMGYFAKNGGVFLYYDNAPKIATTDTGVDVTGVLTAEALRVEGGNATVISASPTAVPTLTLQNSDGTRVSTLEVLGINTELSNSTGGNLRFRTNASELERMRISPDGDISFYDNTGVTQGFFWDASTQRLGLGITTPSATLTVGAPSVSAVSFVSNPVASFGGGVAFDAGSGNDIQLINYRTSNMQFGNGGSVDMTLDSSGNLLVGTTTILTAESNVEGISLAAGSYGGLLSVSRDGNRAATFNRKTSDGDIVEFRKDGTTVGSIGVNTDRIYLVNANEGIAIDDSLNEIFPCNTAGNSLDDTVGLGGSNRRFTDLYLSGGVYLGGTGSANYLDDYEEGSWTPALFIGGSEGTGATYIARDGHYVKVGMMVTIACNLTLSSKGTSTGNFQIGGLPFGVADKLNGTSLGPSGSIGFYEEISSGIYDLGAIFREGVSYIEIKKKTSATGFLDVDAVQTDITDDLNIRVSGTYFTDA